MSIKRYNKGEMMTITGKCFTVNKELIFMDYKDKEFKLLPNYTYFLGELGVNDYSAVYCSNNQAQYLIKYDTVKQLQESPFLCFR